MRMQVRSLASLSGLRIWHCLELWCRSKMQFGSHVAVVVVQAGSYSSDSTPGLGTSICHGCGPKKTKKKKIMVPKNKLHLRPPRLTYRWKLFGIWKTLLFLSKTWI